MNRNSIWRRVEGCHPSRRSLLLCLLLVSYSLFSFHYFLPQQQNGGISSLHGRSSDEDGTGTLKPPTITVAIPSIREDIDVNLPRLKKSIEAQTSLPDEVVLVVSGVQPEECPRFNEWKVICHQPLIHAGIARNLVWERASSELVSFFDADDQMYPERISAIRSYFMQHPDLQLLLHSFSADPLKDHNASVVKSVELDGHAIYATAVKTEGRRDWVLEKAAHGHPTIRKSIHCAPFPAVYGEDAHFVRSCIHSFGNSSEAIAYIPNELTLYVPRNVQKRGATA
ncbi:hypothetical protein HJC23_006382 [Cyclotella cryptica]|uniref:Glycosyltransferase 2-like domain-containing protein n=1 Tax=Cyclotella cryptica TaxID=29204 RepID=A0ABD3Q6B6_9STRA